MFLTIADLFNSPDHYLHSFDGPDAIFVPMDREAYRQSIFLDDRIRPAAAGSMRVPVDALLGLAEAPAPPTAWIFHVAHCGSTLLARALDELGGSLVLREPLALRQVAVARDDARLALTLRMLAKRYPDRGPSIVKANVPVNFILPAIGSAQPDAPSIFLYFQLEDYLLAILRSENHRAWLRRVTSEMAPVLGDLTEASDAERAAALWAAQMRLFGAALARMPNARALDAERFFAEQASTVAAVAALFGLQPHPAALDRLCESSLFASYAKNPAIAFDNSARLELKRSLMGGLASEVVTARDWLAANAPESASTMASVSAQDLV